MTPDSPLALGLIFWPTAALATTGLLFGTGFGVYKYVCHCRGMGKQQPAPTSDA